MITAADPVLIGHTEGEWRTGFSLGGVRRLCSFSH